MAVDPQASRTDVPVPPGKRLRFPLGNLYMTRGTQAYLYGLKLDALDVIARHATGDWGDVCDEDKRANEQAVRHGGRVLSSFTLDPGGGQVWVITEADRSATTVLLPIEY